MNSEIVRLKKAFLFQGLPDEALEVLAQKMTHQKLATNEVLFRRGDQGDSLYIIEEGRIKIVREEGKGGEVILNHCGPGEAIGEMSLFDLEPRSASVIAVTNSQVLQLKREAFFELLDQRPDVSLVLLQSLSSRLRFASTYIQKAIEWSQKIAEGDYSIMDQIQPEQEAESDEDRAKQMLSAFFQMVKGVKAREDQLKQQVQKLTLAIDEARRKQEFEELTGTEFYSKLKLQAQKIREQRKDNS